MKNRPLFLEKMSDEKLMELVQMINDFEIVGATNNEVLLRYADTWYPNPVGLERLMRLTVDVFREAANRWLRTK